ncbi:MAG: HAD family hydrolase [Sphingobacterium sp.]
MQKIKNIILDYGNVIFMIDFALVHQAFKNLGVKDVDNFFAHHGQDSLFDDFDKGSITVAEFRDGVRERAGKKDLTDAQIDQAWNSLLVGIPEGKHDVLNEIKKHYRTFLLSNNNELHYAHCMAELQEKYGIPNNDHFFEKCYYSHLIGKRKPDLAIFKQLIDEQELISNETLFIDDSPQHLEAAQRLGIRTELCTKERPLEKIIAELDLL